MERLPSYQERYKHRKTWLLINFNFNIFFVTYACVVTFRGVALCFYFDLLIHFFLSFQPKRIYYLEDHTGYAMEWVKKIEEVHRAYFGDSTHL